MKTIHADAPKRGRTLFPRRRLPEIGSTETERRRLLPWPALLAAALLLACGPSARKPEVVNTGLDDYIRQARIQAEADRQREGSLWTESSAVSDVFRDVKARRVGDIVTIQVVESTSALNEARTDTSRQSEVGIGFSSLFGLEKGVSELPSLLEGGSSARFRGDASTSRRNVLSTVVTARVLEVFPNGNLLIEGNRELLVNNERQIVVVRGVIRPADVSPQNVVASNQIAELEVEVRGRGIVSESQQPGILFRILSGIWPF